MQVQNCIHINSGPQTTSVTMNVCPYAKLLRKLSCIQKAFMQNTTISERGGPDGTLCLIHRHEAGVALLKRYTKTSLQTYTERVEVIWVTVVHRHSERSQLSTTHREGLHIKQVEWLIHLLLAGESETEMKTNVSVLYSSRAEAWIQWVLVFVTFGMHPWEQI